MNRCVKNLPQTRDLLLIGGGHLHALVLRWWAENPLAGVRLTLVNPEPVAPYTGMLPGVIAGHYQPNDIMIDLLRLARFANARLILDRVCDIDLHARQALLSSGREIGFDVASIDIGISSELREIEGFALYAHGVKPLKSLAQNWEAFVQNAPQSPRITLIGGGVAGVELALAAAHRLHLVGKTAKVSIIERGTRILPEIRGIMRKSLYAALERYGVSLRENCTIMAIGAEHVTLSDGTILPSHFTFCTAGARPHDWLKDTGLALQDGYISVTPTLQTSDPLIFSGGDCAHMAHAPRPKAGVFAIRQAPVLFDNLRASLRGGAFQMREYSPQKDYLKLISLGEKRAVIEKNGLSLGGSALFWGIKNRIDQKFMRKVTRFSGIKKPVLPTEHAADLPAAMGGVRRASRYDLTMLGQDIPLFSKHDDAVVMPSDSGKARNAVVTHYMQAVTLDPYLAGKLAGLQALEKIWALGAQPRLALAKITLPAMSARLQARYISEIMGGISKTIKAVGADVLACTHDFGAMLSIGLTVTGETHFPIHKNTCQDGDVLLLTKPLGSGVLLKAESSWPYLRDHSKLLGAVWQDGLAHMLHAQDDAAYLLAQSAHAMISVANLGLAGHLLEMITERFNAHLSYDRIPLMEGVAQLIHQGVVSDLEASNRGCAEWSLDGDSLGPLSPILFDPQLCGGLLAALPENEAAHIRDELAARGEVAHIIGHISRGSGRIVLS